jgi:hypothetical protein
MIGPGPEDVVDRLTRLEETMDFDIERHQQNRMEFLAVLYESGSEYESIIGQKACLASEDTDRIGRELSDEQSSPLFSSRRCWLNRFWNGGHRWNCLSGQIRRDGACSTVRTHVKAL